MWSLTKQVNAMSKNFDAVEEAVRILRALRAEMHETRDVSLVRAMDDVIERLEQLGSGRPKRKWHDQFQLLFSRGLSLYGIWRTIRYLLWDGD